MSKVLIKSDNVQMSVEYFTDLLKQMGIEYSVKKNSIEFKTDKEFLEEGIPVPLDIDTDDLLCLMTMAHERNITLNKLCNQILREQIEQSENEKIVKKNKRDKK